jgi:hypothetical protein
VFLEQRIRELERRRDTLARILEKIRAIREFYGDPETPWRARGSAVSLPKPEGCSNLRFRVRQGAGVEVRVVKDKHGFIVVVGNECYAVKRVIVDGAPLREPSAKCFEARRLRIRLNEECLIVTGGGK